MAYMSQEGYDKLRAQIKHLEEVERPEVIRQIAEAREKGDLSENAEYDSLRSKDTWPFHAHKEGWSADSV